MSLEQRTIRDAKGNVIGVLGPEAFFSGALGKATAAGIPIAQQQAFSVQVAQAGSVGGQAAINQVIAAAAPQFNKFFNVPKVLPTIAPVKICPSLFRTPGRWD